MIYIALFKQNKTKQNQRLISKSKKAKNTPQTGCEGIWVKSYFQHICFEGVFVNVQRGERVPEGE